MTTNFFASLLNDLMDYLPTKVPAIRWIDQDFGQLENFDMRPALLFPCVLIDFGTTTYTPNMRKSQIGNLTITFRLAFAPFTASHSLAPTLVREQALEYYGIEQDLYTALQGYATAYSSTLTRLSASTELRSNDTLRVRSIQYSTIFQDFTATPPTVAMGVNVGLDIIR